MASFSLPFSPNGSERGKTDWTVVWTKYHCTSDQVSWTLGFFVAFYDHLITNGSPVCYFFFAFSFKCIYFLCRKLVMFDDWSHFAVHVAMDNTVVIEDISK